MHTTIKNPSEFVHLAQQVLSDLIKNKLHILALVGELGAGKTTFTQYLAAALGITTRITSPTFVLLKSYQTQSEQFKQLVHIDLYRTHNWGEVAELGITDFWNNPNTLVVIEWAEKILGHIPPAQTLHMQFNYTDENTRDVTTAPLP